MILNNIKYSMLRLDFMFLNCVGVVRSDFIDSNVATSAKHLTNVINFLQMLLNQW